MKVECWGSELVVNGAVVGQFGGTRGFAELNLYKLPPQDIELARAAITWALEYAKHRGLHGVLASMPNSGTLLSEMGFQVSERRRFRPRFADLAAGKVLQVPHSGNARFIHNGRVWRRETTRRKPRPVWGSWPALGFQLEIDGRQEQVQIEPAADTRVNGTRITKQTCLVDQDTVERNGRVLTYLEDAPGRSALADYYMRYTGMGWENPALTRAVRVFTRP